MWGLTGMPAKPFPKPPSIEHPSPPGVNLGRTKAGIRVYVDVCVDMGLARVMLCFARPLK